MFSFFNWLHCDNSIKQFGMASWWRFVFCGRTDGRTDRSMDRWMDGSMDRSIDHRSIDSLIHWYCAVFSRGYVYLELSGVSGGLYNIRPCTFYPNQEAPFFLNVSSTCPVFISAVSWWHIHTHAQSPSLQFPDDTFTLTHRLFSAFFCCSLAIICFDAAMLIMSPGASVPMDASLAAQSTLGEARH